MKDGIYLNLPTKTYHEELDKDLISASFLKSFKTSPVMAYFEKIGKIKNDSDSLKLGELVHQMILEPKIFASIEFLEEGKYNKKGEEKKPTFRLKQEVDIIKAVFENNENVKKVKDRINNPASIKEIVIISNGKKARLDCLTLRTSGITILDIKTHSRDCIIDSETNSLSYQASYYINDYEYLLQLAFYQNILLEAVNRLKAGEDLHNELPFDIKDINVSQVECQCLMISTKTYEMNLLSLTSHHIESQIKKNQKLIDEMNEYKKKYNGFERIWEQRSPLTVEYDPPNFTFEEQ